MSIKDVGFRIKIAQAVETKKFIDQFSKFSAKWEKLFGAAGTKLIKTNKEAIDKLKGSWVSLSSAIGDANRKFSAMQGITALEKTSKGVDNLTKKVFNLKNALAATAVGGVAVWGVKKILEQGSKGVIVRNRLRREFGSEAGNVEKVAARVSARGGIEDDDAAHGLIPLAEQLQSIQAGSRFRGMKHKLTGAQASALRNKNLNFGGDLLQRLAVLAPEVGAEDAGKVLGDALSGPEGIRSLISTFNLSKRSRTLSTLNEKGQAFKALSPEEQKRLGITKKGQFLEQGDLVNLVLQRSGMTDAAAAEARRRIPYQKASIESQLTNVMGEVGMAAMDRLNEKLGKGATLAENLQKYLASKDGKKTVDDITHSVVKLSEGIIKIVTELPKIGKWLTEHKGTVMALGALYGAGKLVAPVSAISGTVKGTYNAAKWLKGAKSAGSLATLGAVGLTAGVGLAGAAAVYGAYEGAQWVDNHTQFYDKLAGGGKSLNRADEIQANELSTARTIANRLKAGQITPSQAAQQFQAYASASEGGSMGRLGTFIRDRLSTGNVDALAAGDTKSILEGASRPIELTSTTNLVVDGVKMAEVVEKHLAHKISNRTARGAAPVAKR